MATSESLPIASGRSLGTAAVLGLLHATVDAASVAIVWTEAARAIQADDWGTALWLLVLYNGIAFGLQPLIGLVSDRFQADKSTALRGLALTALAVVISFYVPQATIVVGAMGNAMFHVGAGAIVLRRSGGRAAEPGVFVAPGAFGLLTGLWLGKLGFPGRPWIVLALLAGVALLAIWRLGPVPEMRARPGGGKWLVLACVPLLLVSIASRSFLGDLMAGPWRAVPGLALALTIVAVLGKAGGGLIADRIGWRVSAVAAVFLAAAISGASLLYAPVALAGMLLVQLAMPVTLAALLLAFPRHPGTTFGLASAALLAGAVPSFAGLDISRPALVLLVVTLLSAIVLYFGLEIAPRREGPANQ